MVTPASDVVVIGAGVVGSAVAYFLAGQGVKVTVIDGNAIGSGASLHGTGMVWQLIWNNKTQYELAKEGRDLMYDVVPRLHDQTGLDTRLHTFDTLLAIFDDVDMKFIERDLEVSNGDVTLEWLSREELLKLEPRINPEVKRGAVLRGTSQIDGYRLTLAQARAAELHGTEYLTRQATGLEIQKDRVTGVSYAGGVIPCGAVVIAMGAWSGAASEWLGFPVPVRPLKGETIRIRHPEPFPYAIRRNSGGGISPFKDGLHSLGATGTNRFDDTADDLVKLEFDASGTPEGRHHMLQRSLYVIPDLERAEIVEHLAGPRPLSADGMPVIGPVPGVEGAYIATGHRNKGIHLSTITGKIIADFIVKGRAEVNTPLDIFLPQRFSQTDVSFKVAGVKV
ncbi:MAG: FAD-dependent oxidoreductase [Dehalococcoidia bacterium]|jgi:glycine oxidase|nr:FAD-dependent oxidoreductase [Dehalococcoidia bacterium]MDP7202341.1 FAD-dependent oxidoreductase [Dehalococcoidia bacterium]MDP7511465.1 FAD-dependent oxidoreductase [Dehalococcoidia bacterium]